MATAGPARGGRGGFSSPLSILGTPGLRGSWRLSRSLSPPSSRPALVAFWVRTPIPSRGGCAGVPERPGSMPIVTTASAALARAAGGARGGPIPETLPRGGRWRSGRWRRLRGAGLPARLGQSPPTDGRRRPRRAVLCPRRSPRGWLGPAASTTHRGPREERPPGPAPRSPPPLHRRGPERIRPTAKRSKKDPRN